jgi:hypothetical protein
MFSSAEFIRWSVRPRALSAKLVMILHHMKRSHPTTSLFSPHAKGSSQ